MACYRSEFLHILEQRGFLYQGTALEQLDERCAKESIVGYIGFDPTANSFHVGHLIPLMMGLWFQRTGHTPLFLMGGGTAKIGDPSGRDASRTLLTSSEIEENIAHLSSTFERFASFRGKNAAHLINNSSWLDGINYIAFLREVGVHFSVNRMLAFESVKQRLEREQTLSFIEFNYMLLQAYDFLELYKTHGCILQMGGSDQWGNIVSGVDLVRRIEGKEVFGVTWPLLTTSDGAKMGKTAGGAVWLCPHRLSPYDYWQFWRNTHDDDVVRFLKLVTLVPMEEIMRFSHVKGEELNEAKILLADRATELIHGKEHLSLIHQTVTALFSGNALPDSNTLSQLPHLHLPRNEIAKGEWDILKILEHLAFVPSRSQGRALVRSGAVFLDQNAIEDEKYVITENDFSPEKEWVRVSLGRKKHGVVYVKND